MKKLTFFSCLLMFISSLHAEGPPLTVAVDNFSPPFIQRGANQQFFGFDIAMMEYVCKSIKRTCQYRPMPFDQLLAALEAKKVDAALGAITITAERARLVNFSTPYLLSRARFIGPAKLASQPFHIEQLAGKKIGVEVGTAFSQVIANLSLDKPDVIEYPGDDDIINDLYNGKIDFALMDAAASLYWQNQSSGQLSVLGEPFSYGYGFGIALNKESGPLLNQINTALSQYQNSEAYKSNYQKYLSTF